MVRANQLPKRHQDIAPADLKRAVDELGLSDPGKIAIVGKEVEELVRRLYEIEWWLTSTWNRQERLKYVRRVHGRLAKLREDLQCDDPGIARDFGVHLAKPLARILGP